MSTNFMNYDFEDQDDSTFPAASSPTGDRRNTHPQHAGSASQPQQLSTSFSPPHEINRPVVERMSAMRARSAPQVRVDDFEAVRQMSTHSLPSILHGSGVPSHGSPESPRRSSAASASMSPIQATTLQNLRSPGRPQQDRAAFGPLFPPPALPAPSPRKRRTPQPRPQPELSQEEQEAKRIKFLEGNRAAASKSRQKRKEELSSLEETHQDMESQNSDLQREYNELQEEANQIRAQLMTHAHCDDANINRWLETEAERFVNRADDSYGPALTSFGQDFGQPPTASGHDSISSMPGYVLFSQNDLHSPTMHRASIPSISGYAPSTQSEPLSPMTQGGGIAFVSSMHDSHSPTMIRGSSTQNPEGDIQASTSVELLFAPSADKRKGIAHLGGIQSSNNELSGSGSYIFDIDET